MRFLGLGVCVVALASLSAAASGCAGGRDEATGEPAARSDALPTVETFGARLRAKPGFVPLWVDEAGGAIYASLDAARPLECLLVEGLATGLGANPAGLDRGEMSGPRIVEVRVVGDRALVEVQNLGFRASSGDPGEVAAAAAAFPTAVVAVLPVVARGGEGGDSAVLVDLGPLLVRDVHGVERRLRGQGEGKWALEAEASAVEVGATRAFPDNVELESTLTYTSDAPGPWSDSTSPEVGRFSLRQHLSLVRLPEPGFEPREGAPDMGWMSRGHQDFSASLDQPLRARLALRHRLEPGVPLVYYVDRAAPEPIRSALIEGASWWAEAFEAAGFPEGFHVELLPEDADPMDVRYNVINWVHRSTRGWSYGMPVHDPRTGEIIKGQVTLGSQRVRQDRRIFEALLGTARSGEGGPGDPVELALARIRQLAAHEVGHTLGLVHNFAASSYGRASVMDYPAPRIHLHADHLDLTEVYAEGVGAWDLLAFEGLYRDWGGADEEAAGLAELRARAQAEGMVLLSDPEARPRGGGHPEAALWDNGADSVVELREVLAVRDFALARFGPGNLARGAHPTDLELTLAPLYFFHRYQVEAVAKRLGGQRFDSSPDPRAGVTPVEPEVQREALSALVETLDPALLLLPTELSALLRPTPVGHIDALPSYAGSDFDPLALVRAAADMTVAELLDPRRAHRLELQSLRWRSQDQPVNPLSFAEVLDVVEAQLWPARAKAALRPDVYAALELVRESFVEGLIQLASTAWADPRVLAIAEAELASLDASLERSKDAHERHLQRRIHRWLERGEGEGAARSEAPQAPPGSPIGSERSGRSPGGACENYAPWGG